MRQLGARLDGPRHHVSMKFFTGAGYAQLLGEREIAFQAKERTVAMMEAQCLTGHQPIEHGTGACHGPQVGEISETELKLAKDAIERVVTAHDDFDGRQPWHQHHAGLFGWQHRSGPGQGRAGVGRCGEFRSLCPVGLKRQACNRDAAQHLHEPGAQLHAGAWHG